MKTEFNLTEDKTGIFVKIELPLLNSKNPKEFPVKIAGREVLDILIQNGYKPDKVINSAVVRNTSEHARVGEFFVSLKETKKSRKVPEKKQQYTKKTRKITTTTFDNNLDISENKKQEE